MDWKCVQDKQRAEAAAKKLEAKKMAEAEEAALASSAKKPSSKSAGAPKVPSVIHLSSGHSADRPETDS